MINLTYFENNDVEQLLKWIDTPELLAIWGGTKWSFPLTLDDMNAYLNNANDIYNSELLIYKVIEQETGNTIGHISLKEINRKHRTGRISKVLIGDKRMRGKGLCPYMIQKILEIGFEELNLHRISLGVFEFNQTAISCYEGVGFKREGLLREIAFVNGEYWNLVEMSILEDEWKRA